MGEGFGSYEMAPDAELLGFVTSANIACSFHAGDPRTMDRTVRAAVAAGVSVGAHVSYPDLVGFGRRHLELSAEELVTDVLFQIGALEAFCRRWGTCVSYVKAHGALYNDLAVDRDLASAFGDALLAYRSGLAALVRAGSPAVEVLRARSVPVLREGFADRSYAADGSLMPRSVPGSVLHDPSVVVERGLAFASGRPITSHEGASLLLEVDSVCIHGDTAGSVELARQLRGALSAEGVLVRACVAHSR
jgi:UPF0271 protein